MPGRDIITIGASAGGVEALAELVRGLPDDLPASIFVTLHVPSHGSSVLPQILARRGSLPARHASDGEAIVPGRIYVARPDHHLLIHQKVIRLSRGPRENGVRPAIDPLFRTAARWYGPRVVGVILSGTLDDGTAGLLAIKERGGVAIVQDPSDALFPGMPRNAMDMVHVDHVLPASGIPDLLNRMAREERAAPANPIARRFQSRSRTRTASRLAAQTGEAKKLSATIRQMLVKDAAEMVPLRGQEGEPG